MSVNGAAPYNLTLASWRLAHEAARPHSREGSVDFVYSVWPIGATNMQLKSAIVVA